MSAPLRYRINTPLVASQTLEGETVMIHFETGCYYSTDKLGAEIVLFVEARREVGEIALAVGQPRGKSAAEADPLVREFLERLAKEGLVVADSGAAPVETLVPPSRQEGPLLPPVLHKYADLQDLIQLDPIHDTGGAGWPSAPGGGA